MCLYAPTDVRTEPVSVEVDGDERRRNGEIVDEREQLDEKRQLLRRRDELYTQHSMRPTSHTTTPSTISHTVNVLSTAVLTNGHTAQVPRALGFFLFEGPPTARGEILF